MADCGIRILRFHVPGFWWFGDTTGLARRDFELGAYAWVGQADPGGETLWACDQIPSPENGWTGQNYMGWCNEAASDNIKIANNTLIRDDRIKAYDAFQKEFAETWSRCRVPARRGRCLEQQPGRYQDLSDRIRDGEHQGLEADRRR